MSPKITTAVDVKALAEESMAKLTVANGWLCGAMGRFCKARSLVKSRPREGPERTEMYEDIAKLFDDAKRMIRFARKFIPDKCVGLTLEDQSVFDAEFKRTHDRLQSLNYRVTRLPTLPTDLVTWCNEDEEAENKAESPFGRHTDASAAEDGHYAEITVDATNWLDDLATFNGRLNEVAYLINKLRELVESHIKEGRKPKATDGDVAELLRDANLKLTEALPLRPQKHCPTGLQCLPSIPDQLSDYERSFKRTQNRLVSLIYRVTRLSTLPSDLVTWCDEDEKAECKTRFPLAPDTDDSAAAGAAGALASGSAAAAMVVAGAGAFASAGPPSTAAVAAVAAASPSPAAAGAAATPPA